MTKILFPLPTIILTALTYIWWNHASKNPLESAADRGLTLIPGFCQTVAQQTEH